MSKINSVAIDAILNGLSEEQRAVAECVDGPLQVIAGPGSGKTEAMVRRAAVLIDGHGVQPSNILMTTFTEKAADALRRRVKGYVKDKFSVESLTVGTIHSVCLMILEEFGVKSGKFNRGLRVLDDTKQSLFLWAHFSEIGLTEYFDEPSGKLLKELSEIYSAFGERGTNVKKLLSKIDEKDEENSTLVAALKTYDTYKKCLAENQALDFSSILSQTRELLDDESVLSDIRAKFHYVLVDEYQDTNPIQDEILRMIAMPKNNIMVIGDDDQSLYRFRGATVANFLKFDSNVPGVKKLYLSENRRSTPAIVGASVAMAETIPVEGRAAKKLLTKNPTGEKVQLTAYETDEDEIEGTANAIVSLRKSGVVSSYGEVAILVYSVATIYPKLRAALDRHGIPLQVRGDKSLMEQPAIKALLDGMNFFVARDVKDFSLLKAPVFQFQSAKTVSEIAVLSFDSDVRNIKSADKLKITTKADRDRIFEMIRIRQAIVGSSYRKGYTDLVDLFFKLISVAGTLKFLALEESPGCADILDQIGKYSVLVSEFVTETGSKKFSEFKSYYYKVLARSVDIPGQNMPDDAVTLQTIHQSKGLEYPVVLMPGLVESRLPGNRGDSDTIPFFKGVHRYWTEKNKFEDRDSDFKRVLYVAMTRAERFLCLSYFKKMKRKNAMSPYLRCLEGNEHIVSVESIATPTKPLNAKARNHNDKLRISSSHLQYYIFCPTRYRFALKHQVQAPHRGYFAFGSNLHSAIEEASNVIRANGGEPLTKVHAEQVFERHWSNHGFMSLGAASAQKVAAGKRFHSFLENHANTLAEVKYSEKKFTIEEDNFILTGKIDAIREPRPNELTVIDFKTGGKQKFLEEPESLFVNYQANIYVEAVERTLGQTAEDYYLHFLGEDQKVEKDFKLQVPVDLASRKNVIRLLNDTAENIKSEKFGPTAEHVRCANCEFKGVCPFSKKNAA